MAIDIDFYLIASANPIPFICRLAEKVYKSGHWLYIHTNSEKEAANLNETLWTFHDTSFVPHNLYENNPTDPAPVQIGYTENKSKYADILISITPHVPSFYKNFERVLEIIPNDEASKEAGRQKYKTYQQSKCNIKIHKLDSRSPHS